MKWLCNIHKDTLKDYADVYDFYAFLSKQANTIISGYLIGIPYEKEKAAPDLLQKGFIGIYI